MAQRKEQMIGLRRGIEIIERLAKAPAGLPFKTLKQSLADISPSTLSRLLKVMQDEGLIEHLSTERKYKVGARICALGTYLTGELSMAEQLQPVLDRLASKTGCSAAFFEFDDDAIVMVAKSEPPEAFHYMAIGKRNDHFGLHGFAKLAIAYQDAGTQRRLLETIDPPLHLPEKVFLTELKQIKTDGILINLNDDQPVIKRVVAPVFRNGNDFAGAIGISFFHPDDQDQLAKLADIVKLAAENASRKF